MEPIASFRAECSATAAPVRPATCCTLGRRCSWRISIKFRCWRNTIAISHSTMSATLRSWWGRRRWRRQPRLRTRRPALVASRRRVRTPRTQSSADELLRKLRMSLPVFQRPHRRSSLPDVRRTGPFPQRETGRQHGPQPDDSRGQRSHRRVLKGGDTSAVRLSFAPPRRAGLQPAPWTRLGLWNDL